MKIIALLNIIHVSVETKKVEANNIKSQKRFATAISKTSPEITPNLINNLTENNVLFPSAKTSLRVRGKKETDFISKLIPSGVVEVEIDTKESQTFTNLSDVQKDNVLNEITKIVKSVQPSNKKKTNNLIATFESKSKGISFLFNVVGFDTTWGLFTYAATSFQHSINANVIRNYQKTKVSDLTKKVISEIIQNPKSRGNIFDFDQSGVYNITRFRTFLGKDKVKLFNTSTAAIESQQELFSILMKKDVLGYKYAPKLLILLLTEFQDTLFSKYNFSMSNTYRALQEYFHSQSHFKTNKQFKNLSEKQQKVITDFFDNYNVISKSTRKYVFVPANTANQNAEYILAALNKSKTRINFVAAPTGYGKTTTIQKSLNPYAINIIVADKNKINSLYPDTFQVKEGITLDMLQAYYNNQIEKGEQINVYGSIQALVSKIIPFLHKNKLTSRAELHIDEAHNFIEKYETILSKVEYSFYSKMFFDIFDKAKVTFYTATYNQYANPQTFMLSLNRNTSVKYEYNYHIFEGKKKNEIDKIQANVIQIVQPEKGQNQNAGKKNVTALLLKKEVEKSTNEINVLYLQDVATAHSIQQVLNEEGVPTAILFSDSNENAKLLGISSTEDVEIALSHNQKIDKKYRVIIVTSAAIEARNFICDTEVFNKVNYFFDFTSNEKSEYTSIIEQTVGRFRNIENKEIFIIKKVTKFEDKQGKLITNKKDIETLAQLESNIEDLKSEDDFHRIFAENFEKVVQRQKQIVNYQFSFYTVHTILRNMNIVKENINNIEIQESELDNEFLKKLSKVKKEVKNIISEQKEKYCFLKDIEAITELELNNNIFNQANIEAIRAALKQSKNNKARTLLSKFERIMKQRIIGYNKQDDNAFGLVKEYEVMTEREFIEAIEGLNITLDFFFNDNISRDYIHENVIRPTLLSIDRKKYLNLNSQKFFEVMDTGVELVKYEKQVKDSEKQVSVQSLTSFSNKFKRTLLAKDGTLEKWVSEYNKLFISKLKLSKKKELQLAFMKAKVQEQKQNTENTSAF